MEEAEQHQPNPSDLSITDKTTQPAPAGIFFFQTSSRVDASNGIFSNVGRDQYINVATNADPGMTIFDHIQALHLTCARSDGISPLNFKSIHSETFQNREDGTGQWFLDSKIFKDWHDGCLEVLWCPGIRETPLLIDGKSSDLTECWKDYSCVRTSFMQV